MGVYIKGMEMPMCCQDCLFNNHAICMVATETPRPHVEFNKRRDNCPLVPVPPHGRLIDADALIDKVIAKYLEHERMGQLVFAAAEIKQDICDLISDAPTIIPAEEGET